MSALPVVALVAALKEELLPICRRLQDSQTQHHRTGKVILGSLSGHRIVAKVTGEGEVLARIGISNLLAEIPVKAVVVLGVAGALSPDLGIGEIVAATEISDASGEAPKPDRDLLELACQASGVVRGSVISHREIAVDPMSKKRLWQEGGRRAAQLVDLESSSYARCAAERGIPYLVLRAVSDGHDEALPMDLNRYRKHDGSLDRRRIVRFAILHPSVVPELLHLRERVQDCAVRLADVVESLFEAS